MCVRESESVTASKVAERFIDSTPTEAIAKGIVNAADVRVDRVADAGDVRGLGKVIAL